VCVPQSDLQISGRPATCNSLTKCEVHTRPPSRPPGIPKPALSGLLPGVVSVLIGASCAHSQDVSPVTPSGGSPPLAPSTSDGFAVPHPNPRFTFPRDHGRHAAFKLEWWYLTGHLHGPAQERFGFQATIFRRAGRPPVPSPPPVEAESFSSEEIFLSHVALLNVPTGRFLHGERLARAGWSASASEKTLDTRVHDTRIVLMDQARSEIHLDASIRNEARIQLKLTPEKPLVVFGKDGVSRKGASDTAASWYLTFPRLKAAGTVRVANTEWRVEGNAWMDHEISSSQLAENQAGWDWAGIQLDDGREIMTYRLRLKEGSTDPASALVWVARDGSLTHQGADQFRWETTRHWKSPHSGASYPLPVRLHATDPESGERVILELEPLVWDQELESPQSGVPYWEGACRVRRSTQTIGSAYVELTGYSGALGRALDAGKTTPKSR
jgi:predicted secreted hydrolase